MRIFINYILPSFSPYSESICYSTNGPVPSQTDPPMMSDPTSKSMTISWVKRPSDETFTLQMEDESTVIIFLLLTLPLSSNGRDGDGIDSDDYDDVGGVDFDY